MFKQKKVRKIERGQIKQLGKHRLMCGDATNETDVKVLMNGGKADMIFTDPPYNVNYVGQTKVREKLANDKLDKAEFKKFLYDAFANLKTISKPGAMTYVCMAVSSWAELTSVMSDCGFRYSAMLMWVKDRFVISWADYHNQYEPMWYGWTNAQKRLHPLTDRTQSNVWRVKKPDKNKLHPTQKPLELVTRAINNSSCEGDIVVDLFGGSGTTLEACEMTGRACYIMEIDPNYCDKIVERYNSIN